MAQVFHNLADLLDEFDFSASESEKPASLEGRIVLFAISGELLTLPDRYAGVGWFGFDDQWFREMDPIAWTWLHEISKAHADAGLRKGQKTQRQLKESRADLIRNGFEVSTTVQIPIGWSWWAGFPRHYALDYFPES